MELVLLKRSFQTAIIWTDKTSLYFNYNNRSNWSRTAFIKDFNAKVC